MGNLINSLVKGVFPLLLLISYQCFGKKSELAFQNGEEVITPINEGFSIFSNHFYSVGIFLIVMLAIAILIRFFSNVSFDSIDSYTSYDVLKKKLRVLSILAMTLIPLVAYYESEALQLYKAHWSLISVIVVSSLIAFLVSFHSKLTPHKISITLGILLTIIVCVIYLIAFQRELNPTLLLEGAIMLLFSRVVFQKIKHIVYFFIFCILYIALLIGIYIGIDGMNLNSLSILISTTVLSLLVTISLIAVEGSSINNLAFANKILKNSDLFVLVADDIGKIVYVSKPLLAATGRTEKELLGFGWWNYRNKPGAEEYNVGLSIKSTLKTGAKPKYINKLKTLKGVLDVEWTDFALEGKFVMSIGKDVTEQLKYQKEVEMLSLVATSVTNGVVIMNENDELIWNNDQFKELVGLDNENILGKDVIEMLFLKDTYKGNVLEDMSYIEENRSQTVRFNDAKENERFVTLTNSVVNNAQEKKKILVWTDISDQWKIEQRYKDIINNAFDNIYTANASGEFTYVNKRMELNLNTPSDQLLGQRFSDLIHPEDKVATANFYKRQFIRKDPYSYYEFRIKVNNEEDLWVGQNLRLVFDKSAERNVIESHVVARDITESRRNREELRRLSYVASNTENIVIILDRYLKIEWVNDSFTKVFGYDLDEMTGKNPGEVLNGKNTSLETIDKIVYQLKRNEHVSEELINYDKWGNEKWIAISMDPIFDENEEVINYIAVENDISERKAQEILIKHQHESIIDSMNYASIIQSAILPSVSEVKSVNECTFVYYEPKEIIGGDFYLVDSMKDNNGDQLEIYLVADCTGHGVPGAMLSVLCSNLLKEAIRNPKINNPADALSFTRDNLVKTFTMNNEGHSINDGMDVSICVVNRAKQYFHYAGANRPLMFVRDNEVITINGDKQSVGFNHKMVDFNFVRYPLHLDDSIYLFSDGIVDQFGGPKDRKFMTSRFKELLVEVNSLTMEQQLETVKATLKEWKGDREQTDDICLMGVKIGK